MDIIVLDMSVSVDQPFHRLAFSDPMECKLFIHANRSLNTFLESINLILAVKLFAYLRPEVQKNANPSSDALFTSLWKAFDGFF